MINYLIMDVDGTLTDGKLYLGIEGEICKVFNIKDGCGIHDILIPSGIIPIVLSGRNSKIVERRCKELGISQLYQGVSNKLEKINEIFKVTKSKYSTIAYIGDDINDLPCIMEIKRNGGIIGCPFDAVQQVKDNANFISVSNGGDGAVRDFIEYILNKR